MIFTNVERKERKMEKRLKREKWNSYVKLFENEDP